MPFSHLMLAACLTGSLLFCSPPAVAGVCDRDAIELCSALHDSFHELRAWSHDPNALVLDQARWLKSTAATCHGDDCSLVYRARIQHLTKLKQLEVAVLSQQKNFSLMSDEVRHFTGEYKGSGRAAESIFGEMRITDKTISWNPTEGRGAAKLLCFTKPCGHLDADEDAMINQNRIPVHLRNGHHLR